MSRVYGQKLYYRDEHNDDFTSHNANVKRPIDATYKYQSRNIFFRFFGFVLYYLIAVPILWIICKIHYGIKVEGKRNIRKVKGSCVVYSNHVNTLDCAFALVFAAAPKRCGIICHPDAVRIPFVRHLTRMLGAMPLPDNMAAFRNMNNAIDGMLTHNRSLVVMPEAHIWPYYTGIRKFPSTSFTYAARNNVPAIPICVTYRKPKGLLKKYKKPRVTLKIGEPIYPDTAKPLKINSIEMCEKTYNFMLEMSKTNEAALYEYIKTDREVNTLTQIAEAKRAQKLRNKAKRHLAAFGKKVFPDDFRNRIELSLDAPEEDELAYAVQYAREYRDYYNRK